MREFRSHDTDEDLTHGSSSEEVDADASTFAMPAQQGSNNNIAARAAAARVQRKAAEQTQDNEEEQDAGDDIEQLASKGVEGSGDQLPHLGEIQDSFGDHDVSGVEAHTGEAAQEANEAMGSDGYAKDGKVAFADDSPDKELVAHEAAHAVQGRDGGNTGGAGAGMEQHADAVATKVGAGQSAEGLLDQVASRQSASPGPSKEVQRKENKKDDPWEWEKYVLKDVKSGKQKSFRASDVTSALKKLSSASDKAGVRLRGQLQRAVKRSNFYMNGGWGSPIGRIGTASRQMKQFREGADNPHHLAGIQAQLIEASVQIREPAKYANDSRLNKLEAKIKVAISFIINCQTWGKNIDKHHSYVRQLSSMHQSGAVLDHHMLHTIRGTDGINMWREKLMNTYLGNSVVGNSATFKKYETCYGRFLALNQSLKSDKGNGFEKTGPAYSKAQLMAMKDQKVPEYVPSEGPKNGRIDATPDAQKDLNDITLRADELLKQKDAVPGDLFTTITRLKSIRSHVDSYNQSDVDKLLKRLDVAFAKSSDPKHIQKDKSQGVAVEFDLDKGITISHIRSALNTIANEPGETGQLSFKLTVRASYGNAIIKGFVEGWAQLKLFYGVGDTMSCFMGFDASAAFGAGISLAGGLLEGKVEGGGGFGMKAKFGDPGQAATWLWYQLKRINDKADEETGGRYKPFTIIGAAKSRKPKPTVVTETRVFGGASGGVDAGVAGGSASIQKTSQTNKFEKDGKSVTGSYDETQRSYSAFVKVGDWLVNVGYTKTDSVTKNDANTTNDGTDQNHQFALEVDLTKTIQKSKSGTSSSGNIMKRAHVFKIISSGLSKFESLLPGGKVSKKLIDSLTTGVSEKVFEVIEHGRKRKLGASITMDIEWNMAKEGGQWREEYVRAGITPKFKAGFEIDAKAKVVDLNIKGEAEASKREVVFEDIGTDTSGYVFQRYVFAWDDQQWKDFVNENKDDVNELMKNMADPRNNAYDKDFAKKVKKVKGRGFQGRLEVLQAHWDTKRGELKHKNMR
jgi:hypothetical protein